MDKIEELLDVFFSKNNINKDNPVLYYDIKSLAYKCYSIGHTDSFNETIKTLEK